MKNIIASLLKLTKQIAPFQGGDDKVCRGLEHIRCVFQRFYRRIVHPVKSDKLFAVIEGDHHKRMDVLLPENLKLKRIRFPDILQALNDNMLSDAEIPIPAGAHLWWNILKILLFRLHPVCRPLIGVVIPTCLVPLKYIGPFPLKRFSQVF